MSPSTGSSITPTEVAMIDELTPATPRAPFPTLHPDPASPSGEGRSEKGHAHHCVCDFSKSNSGTTWDVRPPHRKHSRASLGLEPQRLVEPRHCGLLGLLRFPKENPLSDSSRVPHPQRSVEPSQHFPCEKMRQLRLHSEIRLSPVPRVQR